MCVFRPDREWTEEWCAGGGQQNMCLECDAINEQNMCEFTPETQDREAAEVMLEEEEYREMAQQNEVYQDTSGEDLWEPEHGFGYRSPPTPRSPLSEYGYSS